MPDRVLQPTPVLATTRFLEVAPTAAGLQEHVREIVESPAFKGSPRSQQFLHYVIETAIAGRADQLKERNLGVELFGRPASYDTGEDAIVRVTASDVRKRLHLFYAESFNSEWRVDLPSGSYIPEFRHLAAPLPSTPTIVAETAPVPEEGRQAGRRSRLRVQRLVLCAIGAVLIGSSVWFWHQLSSPSRLSPRNLLPWSVLLQRGRQIQLVLSDPDISAVQELLGFQVSLSDYANRRYVPDSLSVKPETRQILTSSFRGVDVASVDVGIALQISELALTGPDPQHAKTHTARSLQLASFKTDDDFILLGSPRSNPWGGLFEDRLDFEFVYDANLKQEIIRNNRPQQGELPLYVPTAKGWDTGQAFAIVAFVGNPSQAGQVLLLAGTNAEGTEAAGKVATNADLLSGALQRCGIDPSGAVRHFQALLRVQTMAGSPNALEVIACHRLPNTPLP